VLKDGRDVGELAKMKQRELEVRGWQLEQREQQPDPVQTDTPFN
jgi:hypothetical protein